jgi:hypothetical protein
MKRFFCTKCGKVKRTQEWPTVILFMRADGAFATIPEDRIGECNWHTQGHIRPVRKEYERKPKATVRRKSA